MTERESMMDEYIERELLVKYLEEEVVEVVRCKDCEYGREEDHNTYSCANFPDGIGGYISGECFCSYGERKEN